ncbi:MAG TPA: hypothetical protein VKU90_13630 [Caulobacteraceae bacterium]|nr:hypothetical protein [Caulobacteraceae bacterium]
MRFTTRLAGLVVALAIAAGAAHADTILFVGNSFTFGALSPVWKFHAAEVSDLNGGGVGGVPALFKLFTEEAGLDYTVSLETVGGKDLQFHLDNKRAVIDQSFDHVVLQSFSTLDAAHPGDPASLIRSTAEMARMFHAKNPKVDVWLDATWSRADQTYLTTGHWYGKPIGQMGIDVEQAYLAAAAGANAAMPGAVSGVAPVGLAWNRAFDTGFADADPYDGIQFGQVNLWAFEGYHASSFGYYIEALVIFGAVTGKDPLSLGPRETAATELGFSPAQTTAMQQIAHDQLAASLKR